MEQPFNPFLHPLYGSSMFRMNSGQTATVQSQESRLGLLDECSNKKFKSEGAATLVSELLLSRSFRKRMARRANKKKKYKPSTVSNGGNRTSSFALPNSNIPVDSSTSSGVERSLGEATKSVVPLTELFPMDVVAEDVDLEDSDCIVIDTQSTVTDVSNKDPQLSTEAVTQTACVHPSSSITTALAMVEQEDDVVCLSPLNKCFASSSHSTASRLTEGFSSTSSNTDVLSTISVTRTLTPQLKTLDKCPDCVFKTSSNKETVTNETFVENDTKNVAILDDREGQSLSAVTADYEEKKEVQGSLQGVSFFADSQSTETDCGYLSSSQTTTLAMAEQEDDVICLSNLNACFMSSSHSTSPRLTEHVTSTSSNSDEHIKMTSKSSSVDNEPDCIVITPELSVEGGRSDDVSCSQKDSIKQGTNLEELAVEVVVKNVQDGREVQLVPDCVEKEEVIPLEDVCSEVAFLKTTVNDVVLIRCKDKRVARAQDSSNGQQIAPDQAICSTQQVASDKATCSSAEADMLRNCPSVSCIYVQNREDVACRQVPATKRTRWNRDTATDTITNPFNVVHNQNLLMNDNLVNVNNGLFTSGSSLQCNRMLTQNVTADGLLIEVLRPIAIDGSNVAFSHGNNRQFSCRGIAFCIEYFLKRGHTTVKAFVPQFRRQKDPRVVGRDLLETLGMQQLVVFTPSRQIDGRNVVCHDDRFVLEYAHQTGAVIVSNDNFRDMVSETPAWRTMVANRLLMYTFADDIFMVPQDPLGRHGPSLQQFLSF